MSPKFDMSGLRGFLILLYKGLLLRKRHFIITGFEIIFPLLIGSIPAIIVSEQNIAAHGGSTWVNETTYDPIDPFVPDDKYIGTKVLLVYTPSNNHTDKLMKNSIEIWGSHNTDVEIANVSSFDNADDLENFCQREQRENQNIILLGTVFNNIDSSRNKLPSGLDYTIRYAGNYGYTNFYTDMKYRFSPRYIRDEYTQTYFLSWQASIDKAFIDEKTSETGKKPLDYKISMQRFPYPGYNKSTGFSLAVMIPSMLIYGFIVFIVNVIRRVLEEKSNGSKELLKMMGMSNTTYWLSTFMNFFGLGAFVMLIVTIVYKAPLKNSVVLLEYSNFFIILFIFLLFIASLVLFCLAVTCFFNKAVLGIIFLIIVYNVGSSLLQVMLFNTMEDSSTKYMTLSVFKKFCICLFPPGALYSAFEIVTTLESSGEGAVWSSLYSYDVVPDFSLSDVMLSMLFSCFLYALIIWYVDAVWPWQPGVPKPFYFLFTRNYWCGYQESKTNEILLGMEDDAKSTEFFEDDPTGISPGVVIHNLSKVFRTGFQTKVAVNNLSLNIYNGQITALLGHNGAGKTTTINILTGLYSPSGGSASINGWDIFRQTTKARQSIGVCPQHNVLYDTLTVEEHLRIYAALKGVRWSQLNQETENILKMLHLLDKKRELTKNLSGGMKRKLSLGIAIIGGSKVLFLDEPTSGMDVEARRSVWDALLELRLDRTVVLTTHYMEEADILGDRIAIMAEGEIQCCGSPLFLKKKFGTGYHLHLVKNENFDMSSINQILVKHIPGATLENEYERDVTFNLMSNTHSSFGALFQEVESNKEKLGINSCGVTVTTMEDVFLNVTNIADLKMKNQETGFLENADETELKDIYMESGGRAIQRNFRYWENQFKGLIMKRLHYSKRHWSILISQLVIPFLMLCLCFFSINTASFGSSMYVSPLKIDVKEVYGITDGFYSSDDSSKLFADKLAKILQNNGVNVQLVDNPEQYILGYANKNLGNYLKKFIVGGSVGTSGGKMNLTAWYNGLPYHSTPMSLLAMDSAILKNVDESGYITLTNHPLPKTDRYIREDTSHSMEKLLANIFFPLAFAFVTSSFVLVPIQERTSKAKLIQLMTGIPAAFYWFAMFAWDFFIHTVISVLLIIPFAIFAGYAFFSPHSEAIGTALLMMILYGWSSIPFSYLFTLIFQKPNTGFSVVNTICVIAGVALSSILTAVYQMIRFSKTAKAFIYLCKLLPPFSLASGFGNLFAIAYGNAFCESLSPKELKFNCDPKYVQPDSPIFKCCKDICGDACMNSTTIITFEEYGCAREILFLFGDGFLYFTLLLLFESSLMASFGRLVSQKFSKLRRRVVNYQPLESNFVEDSDVLQEEQRILSDYQQLAHNEALVAVNLSKTFKGLKAVDRLTFGIHKKECFGLLGVNGAGKTTTFRMLTGDCYPDEGNAYVGSCSVISNLKEFQSHIGYCPQFDALIDRLTGREMITLFARLRGLSGEKMERTVNALIKMTDLTKYADKPSMVYSGGNKRKLSIALALIGSPPLILLDEPTAGVDPVSRRKIWKILSLARNYTGAAVILTTHSMEESEALCSRLAIMVNGRFRCLGSIQQLKTKFGQGYSLIIKMKNEEQVNQQSINAIKAYIDTNLPGAQLKDDHQGMLQYHVVDSTVTLSYMFKFMDDMKEKCNLEDYVVSDTSLEQIFLTFARSQRVVAAT